MMKVIQYILDNKEWIFSGIGVPLIVFILSFIYRKMNKRKPEVLNEIKSSPINLTNSNSNTVQIINNQTNYTKETKIETSQEVKNSLKELFRLLDSSIKSVEIGLAPYKMNPPKSNSEYLEDAVENYISFSDYFDSNEFLYDKEIIRLVKEIRELIHTCLKNQRLIEDLKNMNMSTDIIFKEGKEANKAYEKNIKKEVPVLRSMLTEQINKYFIN